jgi:hypothetical protein
MKTIVDIEAIIQKNKKELEEKYGLKEIGIFGSYTKEEQIETSDIDILVDFQKAIDLLTFVHLKNHLSKLLNVNVDLVMKRALKPKIGKRILRDVIYI